jgi:hypothetical protein
MAYKLKSRKVITSQHPTNLHMFEGELGRREIIIGIKYTKETSYQNIKTT